MTTINHVLLEVYCRKAMLGAENEVCPTFCPSNGEIATYQCLFHQCQYVDFTSCENTFCYIGEHSDEEYGISFGGEMESEESVIGVDDWKNIAIQKIDEAYEEFLKQKKQLETSE